jgi:hypothetical protein
METPEKIGRREIKKGWFAFWIILIRHHHFDAALVDTGSAFSLHGAQSWSQVSLNFDWRFCDGDVTPIRFLARPLAIFPAHAATV